MRDYSKVSGSFWTGKTGRELRGDMQAQIVAMYLMTSPHAEMIGVFHCPILYIAHETGSPLEGATKALARLIEGGFCTYDYELELVWVHEMARFQVGDDLKAGDLRIKGIQKYFDSMAESPIKHAFFEKYGESFHIQKGAKKGSPLQAPCKPLRSQEQEQEQEQEQKKYLPDDLAIAEMILAGVMEVNPKHKSPSLEKWADEIRLMRERDSRTLVEIKTVFAWANADSFWRTNILSPQSLRKNFDKLVAKMNSQPGSSRVVVGTDGRRIPDYMRGVV